MTTGKSFSNVQDGTTSAFPVGDYLSKTSMAKDVMPQGYSSSSNSNFNQLLEENKNNKRSMINSELKMKI